MLELRISVVPFAASCISLVLPLSALAQTVIMTENFESPTVMAPSSIGFDTYGVGEPLGDTLTTATNTWTVTAANIDHVSTQGIQGSVFSANDGSQVIDMGGTPGAGVVETSFPTVPGRTYQLDFFYAHNDAASDTPACGVRILGAGGSVLLQDQVTHTIFFRTYLQFTDTFVADSTTTRLEFQSQNTGIGGVALDTISVTDLTPTAVPVLSTPIAILILSGGLATTGHIALRRRLRATGGA